VAAPKLSFAAKVFMSLIAGAICGLFFGEKAQILAPIGTIFIKLMQVSVLPSVVIFIITGIGSINKDDAKEFLKKAALIMLLIWILGIIGFHFMQFAFPNVPSASFFSTAQLSRSEDTDLIELFIPSNPFKSLSEGLMPGIVLFCLLFGFALIGDDKNKPFVELLKGLSSTLSKITKILMMTAPLGIFAITANTAGTITLTQLLQIQVFFISTVVISVIMILLVLPLLVHCLTPLSYREILTAANKAVLLGFSTSQVFITLPILAEGVSNLFKDPRTEEKAKSYGGILVPLAFSFPPLGDFMVLLFVLFTGWYYNSPLDLKDQINLALVGVPSFFGSSKLAVQMLLQVVHLPADAFQLYLISQPFSIYFTAALTCMGIFSFSAICTAFLSGCGGLRLKRALISLIIVAAILASVVLGLRFGFATLLGDSSQTDETILSMKMPLEVNGIRVDQNVDVKVFREYLKEHSAGDEFALENGSWMASIWEKGFIRVGYVPDILPFSFFNKDGELVGYDIHMAYDMARLLNISRIEFIPVDRKTGYVLVNNGSCDIIMCSVDLVPGMVGLGRFTSPHIELHMAFVTKDYRKDEFQKLEDVAGRKGLKIAIPAGSEYYEIVKKLFPLATIIPLDHPSQFFNHTEADALLTSAETGSAMTLMHPFYDVTILQPVDTYKIMCVYVVSNKCDDASLMFLDYWIKMEEDYGSLDRKYKYWILGENPEKKTKRWSVIRDVLHWTE